MAAGDKKKPKKKPQKAGEDWRSGTPAKLQDLQDQGKTFQRPAAEDEVVFSREVVTVWRHSDPEPLEAVWLGIRSRRGPEPPHLVLQRNGERIEIELADVEHLAQPGGRRVA
jgi:hypothetical protein